MTRAATLMARIGSFIDRRLERDVIRFVGATFLLLGLAAAAVGFLSFDGTHTLFGPPLGADFAGFYTAGAILNNDAPERVYDLELQDRLFHELLPRLPIATKLPYVYPPFFTPLFRPLALLPYRWAWLLWTLISIGLYAGAAALLWRSRAALPESERPIAFLLAASSQPLFESVLSGQTSAFGFLAMAAAIRCEMLGRPLLAGLCLALCWYKPPLLLVVVPMLALGRRWRTLGGLLAGGTALAALSPLAMGWQGCLAYAHLAAEFSKVINERTVSFPNWKFVDLSHFYVLLLGRRSSLRGPLWTVSVLAILALLGRAWWRSDRLGPRGRALLWSSTLTWTLVANLYVGIYDAVLATIGAFLTTDELCRRTGGLRGALVPGSRSLLVLFYLVPWISQPVAIATGFQPFTLVLIAMGTHQLMLTYRSMPVPAPGSASRLAEVV